MIKIDISLSIIFLIGSVFFAFVSTASSQTDSNTVVFNANLNSLIYDVQRNNPQLKAQEHRIDAALADVKIKGSLGPPQLNVEFMTLPNPALPESTMDLREIDYSMQQEIPFPGKLASMANVARKRKEMYVKDRQTAALDLIQIVKINYYQLYFIYRRSQINIENQELLRGFIDIARKQYELGLGSQADILRGQTELSTLESDLVVLHQEQKSIESTINSLRNKPVNVPLPLIPEISPPEIHFTYDQIAALARKNRPELASFQYGIEMQKEERKVARKEFYPDFMLRGTYKQMIRIPDNFSVMLGITLPVAPWTYGRYKAGSAQANANTLQAQEEYADMQNTVLNQVQDALLKIESSSVRIDLYRNTVIPQASQTLQSTLAGYRTGKQNFLTLIDGERVLLSSKQNYHESVMNLLISIAQLERASGMTVSEMENSLRQGKQQ